MSAKRDRDDDPVAPPRVKDAMANLQKRRQREAKETQSTTGIERIVLVATDLFAERGYVGTTIAQIADAAGVSRALLFFHFGSKEGLLKAVLEEARAEIANVLQEGDGLRGLAAMRSFLDARTRWFRERPQVARLVLVLGSEAIASDQDPWMFLEFQDRRAKLFARCIAEAIEDGDLRSDIDADGLAYLLVAATDGDQRMWALDPKHRRVEQTDTAILRLLESLGPPKR